jgi:hypothetical protein
MRAHGHSSIGQMFVQRHGLPSEHRLVQSTSDALIERTRPLPFHHQVSSTVDRQCPGTPRWSMDLFRFPKDVPL